MVELATIVIVLHPLSHKALYNILVHQAGSLVSLFLVVNIVAKDSHAQLLLALI